MDKDQVYRLEPHRIEGLKIATLRSCAQVTCLSTVSELTGEELKRAAYAVMRPPAGGIALQLIPEPLRDIIPLWQQHRGNSAVFVCPFTDCHHVSDADQQAALNIAIRGYAKLQTEGRVNNATDLVESPRAWIIRRWT